MQAGDCVATNASDQRALFGHLQQMQVTKERSFNVQHIICPINLQDTI